MKIDSLINELKIYKPLCREFCLKDSNKVKILNHRWIIADFSDGEIWGEVLLKYFVNDDESIAFEVNQSLLYQK